MGQQVRTVLTWRNTAKTLMSFMGVVDCWATASSPHCSHTAQVGGKTVVSENQHDVEIAELGQGECKFGLSTISVTGEGASIAKYMVAVKGDSDLAILGHGGDKAFVSASQLAALKRDYSGADADVVF